MISNALSTLRELGYTIQASKKLITEDYCSSRVTEELSSSCKKIQREGLKKITCMLQRNKDCSSYYASVLGASDTPDPFVKRMASHYLCRHISASAASYESGGRGMHGRQVPAEHQPKALPLLDFKIGATWRCERKENVICQCTNTLLKDLSDRNEDLRNAAIEFLIEVGDNESFPSFSKKLRRIMASGSDGNKVRIALLIERLVQNDPAFVEKNDLVGDVQQMIRLGPLQLQICALSCLSFIALRYIKKEDVLQMLEKITSAPNHDLYYKGIDVVTRMVASNKDAFNGTELALITDKLVAALGSDLYTAFCAARALLQIDPRYLPQVFEQMCLFLYTKDEDLFHLLVFLHEMLRGWSNPEYDTRLFAIFDNDRDYIKAMKLRILATRCDGFSVNEILRLSCNAKFEVDVLRFCFENEIANSALFQQCLATRRSDVERLVWHYRPSSSEWVSIIAEKYRASVLTKEALFVVSTYFPGLPVSINMQSANKHELLRFYTKLHLRGILDKPELVERCAKLAGEDAAVKIEWAVLSELCNSSDARVLYEYAEPRLSFVARPRLVQTPCWPDLGNDVMELRPFQHNNDTMLSTFIKPEGQNAVTDNEYVRRVDAGQAPDNITLPEDGMIRNSYVSQEKPLESRLDGAANGCLHLKRINNVWFIGSVYLRGCSVMLKAQSMTRPFTVSTKQLRNDEVITISDATDQKIGEVNTPHPFSIKISDLYGYSVGLTCKACVMAFECDLLTFNDMFNRAEEYVIVPRSFATTTQVYVLDRVSFSFQMVGHLFFGKVMNGEAVLKGTNGNLLKAIAKEFN